MSEAPNTVFTTRKKPRLSEELTHDTYHEHDADLDFEPDNVQFELDIAPELEILTQSIVRLSLDEKGDELQEKAIDLAVKGRNIFLTGKAGTGKSFVVSRIVNRLKSENMTIHATAPSGIAAMNVNGCTINTWGGFRLGEYYKDYDMMMSKVIREKIKATDCLLIDEISMLNGELFDVLEYMVTYIRCYEEVKDVHKLTNSKEIGVNIESQCIMSLSALKMRWVAEERGGLAHLPPVSFSYNILTNAIYLFPLSLIVHKVGRHATYLSW